MLNGGVGCVVRGRNEENIIEQAKTHSGLWCQKEENKKEKKENPLEQKKEEKLFVSLKISCFTNIKRPLTYFQWRVTYI